MELFLSTYYNKVDSKCRVSVPAQFREVLNQEDDAKSSPVIVNKSYLNDCIEGSSLRRMEELNGTLEGMTGLSSEVQDAFLTFLLGNSIALSFDGDGRIVLPRKLLQEVGIEDKAVFVGKGKIFEIWSPDKFDEYQQKVMHIVALEKEKIFLNRGHGYA